MIKMEMGTALYGLDMTDKDNPKLTFCQWEYLTSDKYLDDDFRLMILKKLKDLGFEPPK